MTETKTATATESDALQRLLVPESIAVIGASADPAKRGHQIIRALQESGYAHPVYPVNPSATEILGLPVVPDVGALPHGVDIAVVAVPAARVPEVLRQCAAAGVSGAVVLANGFAETGAAGAAITDELAAVIAGTGVRVVGPNTSGLLNTASGANLVGLPDVPHGPISVITQSGNMLLSLVQDNRTLRGPGFHIYVGLGNQADVRYGECLTILAQQTDTRAVAVHAEGFTDGRAFLTAATHATATTPVVVLRGGRSAAGRRTVLSHTGSIAASDAVATAVLRQAGVELVTRSDELAVVAGALATCPPVRPGRRVAVLSDGGGHAALAVDALAGQGVELAELGQDTTAALRELLGPAAAVADPVDVAGATDSDPTVFAAATEILIRDPAVGMVVLIGLFGGYHRRFDHRLETAENQTAERLLRLSAEYGTPLLVQSCYAGDTIANHDILRGGGVPVVASVDHAARIVAALDRRRARLATAAQRSSLELPPPAEPLTPVETVSSPAEVTPPESAFPPADVPREPLADIRPTGELSATAAPTPSNGTSPSSGASSPGRAPGPAPTTTSATAYTAPARDTPAAATAGTAGTTAIDEPRARKFLAAAGIDPGPWTFAASPSRVAAAVTSYGCPCAVRIVSPQVLHKSDAGGVRLGVTAETALEVSTGMVTDVRAAVPGARIDGFLVTPMAGRGVELLIGATNDPTFGPVVAFGSGGLLVEALDDVTFRAAPFTEFEAAEMIAETRIGRVLDGYRGLPTVDRTALARLLVQVGELVAAHPEITELDLNPVIAGESGIVPVDIRIIVREQNS
ncbi:acetate--CoA ligase family protein [Nocardia donostiensis]|uniref:CoA-binding domain-containing protein n=1 Tax=Nocardia donostiensis TaxID=1538463 RepID=A0A1W0B7G1_9NOCA|nr:acetate--CoA ligase [Nocardia donostiensis]ONM46931.1 hypothetical protein B0T46_20895 [Nocardia donostiensis]OQS18371.1 hypothetical protein B0T44_19885 [Nocardia donostiensis]